jgi:hypothetical protein
VEVGFAVEGVKLGWVGAWANVDETAVLALHQPTFILRTKGDALAAAAQIAGNMLASDFKPNARR